MKKIISLVLVILVTAMVLTGCMYDKLTSGEVYEKEFLPERNESRIMPLIIYNGKTSNVYMIPYNYHYPNRWVIRIKAFQNEKWQTEDYYVPQDVYDKVNVGDEFTYDPDKDLDDEPYTRTRTD